MSRSSGAPGGAGLSRAPGAEPALGTGTSMVRIAGLSTVFGYSRCDPDLPRVGQLDRGEPDVGALLGDVGQPGPPRLGPQPGHRRAGSATGSGGGPYRSASSSRTAAMSSAESMAAIRV